MRDVEVVADWVNDLAKGLRAAVLGLSVEELTWQPDPEANNIGVTVWHCARWLDVLAVRLLGGQAAEEELWHTQGWLDRTSYDPRGVGYAGLGTVTGYTQADVAAIPVLTADDLIAYLDQAIDLLNTRILALGDGKLYEPAPGGRNNRSANHYIKMLVQGCFGHIGEIDALKSMRARQLQPA